MEKIVLLSDSDRESARETGTPSRWLTAVHVEMNSRELAVTNPWNNDQSFLEKQCYLMDDCVVSFRPARYEDRISRAQDYNKDYYFLEISNQDRSSISTSNKVYSWDEAVRLGSYFKGLTFTAGSRVWKSKSSRQSLHLTINKDAFRRARSDAGIPLSQRPEAVSKPYLKDGHGGYFYKNHQKVTARSYHFTNGKGEQVIIQDHSCGHTKAAPLRGAERHFNVRPITNSKTGTIEGTHGHHNY